jgi:deoxyadenosine/deoxycytidine kinase
MAVQIISIEGNIGTGKSTLLGELRKKYASDDEICFLDEPVHVWNTIKDEQGVTILEKYYADQNRYAFSFQMMAYISRLSAMRAALKKNYKIIITERSIYTDSAVFAKMLFDDGKIEDIEYKIYNHWLNEFIADFPPIKFIYLQADPTISFQRVALRGRLGEVIPLDYLQNCHDYHEEWLFKKNNEPLLVLNANTDVKESTDIFERWMHDIDAFIKDEY